MTSIVDSLIAGEITIAEIVEDHPFDPENHGWHHYDTDNMEDRTTTYYYKHKDGHTMEIETSKKPVRGISPTFTIYHRDYKAFGGGKGDSNKGKSLTTRSDTDARIFSRKITGHNEYS